MVTSTGFKMPEVSFQETVVLLNAKGAGTAVTPADSEDRTYVFGGRYSLFAQISNLGGITSVALQVNVARPGDTPIWLTIGSALTATPAAGVDVYLGAKAQVRCVVVGGPGNASTDIYFTLTRIPA